MTPLVVRAEAEADIRGARAWYAERDEALAERFLQKVDWTLDLIGAGPRTFPTVHRTLRRALLRRFPYCVFFDARDEVIEVFAVFHAHRDPAIWRSRT